MYGSDDVTNYYAPESKITPGSTQIQNTYLSMLRAIQPYNNVAPQQRKSTEGYRNNPDKGINNNTDYNSIPNGADSNNLNLVEKSSIFEGPFLKYLKRQEAVNELRIDNRGFAKASNALNVTGSGVTGTPDEYNLLPPTDNINKLLLKEGSNQSKDLIFFYFYDLINKKYIPFRATLGSIQDNNTGDWEDIKYMGRADKLYVYKGFSREVSFNFKVYANSIYELVPNWERVNYLVGLTRPSKYTDRAFVTRQSPPQPEIQSQAIGDMNQSTVQMTPFIVNSGESGQTTGLESGFIYPPMIEFRIGDLYVDQPAVLRNVGITVPDDAQWETLRDNKYTYVYGNEKTIIQDNVYSRQLPNIIDVSIQLSIIEREKSRTGNYNFGPQTGWVIL
jgi:hypothetical protein